MDIVGYEKRQGHYIDRLISLTVDLPLVNFTCDNQVVRQVKLSGLEVF